MQRRLCATFVLLCLVRCDGAKRRDVSSQDASASKDAGQPKKDTIPDHNDGGSAGRDGAAGIDICDGTDNLRFGLALDGQTARRHAFQAVQVELGFPYLFVDGRCRYFVLHSVGDSLALWRATRTGVLTPQEKGRLASLVGYGDLSKWNQCQMVVNTTADAPDILFTDGSAVASCPQDTENELVRGWYDISEALWQRGNDVDSQGGLRIEVGSSSETSGRTAYVYSWPLGEPIGSFATPSASVFSTGVSRKVYQQEDIAALIQLRDKYLNDVANDSFPQTEIRIKGGYVLYMRSELPFTKPDGLLPID